MTVGDYQGARRTFRSALTVMLVFGAAATLLTWFGADWIAVSFSNQPRTAMMFRTIAPTFLFTAIAGSLRGYFQGRQNMTPTAISQVIEQGLEFRPYRRLHQGVSSIMPPAFRPIRRPMPRPAPRLPPWSPPLVRRRSCSSCSVSPTAASGWRNTGCRAPA